MTRNVTRQLQQTERAAELERFRCDVLSGLGQSQKTIPSKYLYDERGSQLFDLITQLDEYYLARAESEIMQVLGDEIARQLGEHCLLIEYGSGSSTKTRILLDHLPSPAGYVPIDISEEHLRKSAAGLQADYPGLAIFPVAADFTAALQLPEIDASVRQHVIYFPGSTIGNFSQPEARKLLLSIAQVVGPGGGLLLGVDLQKSLDILLPAYNDRDGVTAAFNLNLLRRINRELDADFDVEQFEHRAEYNQELHCIEMRLISQRDQTVRIGNEHVRFYEGESILTERSHKYSLDGFADLARSAGFEIADVWMDRGNLFSIQYLTVLTHANAGCQFPTSI